MKDSLLFVGLAQALFTILILVYTSRKDVSNKILIATLGVISLRFLIQVLNFEHIISGGMGLSMLLVPLSLGPFIYLYTRYKINGKKKLNTIDYLHFFPLIIALAVYTFIFNSTLSFYEVDYFEKDQYLWVRIL